MAKYASGIYTPKNPQKYIGKGSIKYRSSWELVFMTFCDNNPNVLQWASESVKIPYRNPLTGKQSIYLPDFIIVYQDANGGNHAECIEIKPSGQVTMEAAKSRHDKLHVVKNMAKWQAASAWCKMNKLTFRIISEKDLFKYGSR